MLFARHPLLARDQSSRLFPDLPRKVDPPTEAYLQGMGHLDFHCVYRLDHCVRYRRV